jgi:DNA-binding beta-propeller fold protein YncE
MIDANTDQVVARSSLGRNPQDITWAADDRFACTVNVEENTSIAVHPDGTIAHVPNVADGTITLLDLAG